MEGAFPGALVDRSLYEHVIPAMPHDEKERPVLTATVANRAGVLVTGNIKAFQVAPRSFSVAIQHPDTPFMSQARDLFTDFIRYRD